MPDESRNVVAFYERNAENWKRERSRSLFEKHWLDRFLAHVPQGGEILDLGCGDGRPIAEYFINAGYRVTGVDSSMTLLSACRSAWAHAEWHAADMRGIDLGKAFDAVLAWDSFFHLTRDDQAAMMPVFMKHAKPGAPLMFTAGPDNGERINPLWDASLYHASLSKDEYETLLQQHGFRLVDYKREDPGCGGHTVYLAQRL